LEFLWNFIIIFFNNSIEVFAGRTKIRDGPNAARNLPTLLVYGILCKVYVVIRLTKAKSKEVGLTLTWKSRYWVYKI